MFVKHLACMVSPGRPPRIWSLRLGDLNLAATFSSCLSHVSHPDCLATNMPNITAALGAFLQAQKLDPFEETLKAQYILTLELLGDALDKKDFKDTICNSFAPELLQEKQQDSKQQTSFGKEILVAKFKALEKADVEKALKEAAEPTLVESTPNPDLAKFLEEEGIPDSLLPVFALHSVTSKESLRVLVADDVRRGKLVQNLSDGVRIGSKRYPPDLEAAQRIEALNPVLAKFLEEEGIPGSLLPVFALHSVTSKESLRVLVADDVRRGKLVQNLRNGVRIGRKSYPPDPETEKRIEALKSEQVEVVKAKANPELGAFLKSQGIPESHTPVFEKNGITSLQGLNSVLNNPHQRAKLVKELKEGTSDGTKHYEALPTVADQVGSMPLSDVRDALVREQKPAAMTQEFDDRQTKLQAAIAKVEDLRSVAAAEAKENSASTLKAASDALEKILAECNADELLEKLATPAHFATLATLDAALKDAGTELANKLSATQLKGLDKIVALGTPELAAQNGLFRGVLLRATEISDVSGSDLLLPRCRFTSIHAKQERTRTFGSEEASQYAAKTMDRSSSTFATSNKASGAAFIGSGIGAISLAGAHARAKMEYRATERAAASSFACRSMAHRIDVTRGTITIPMDQAKLTPEALRALQAIGGVVDVATQERYALTFLLNFGSHVYARATLGGRYDYIATAVATTREKLERIDTALSQASNWQVSSSAGYASLSGVVSVTSGNEGSNTNSDASSEASKKKGRSEDVRTNTEIYGGLDQLTLEYWKQSLEKNALWYVLDRQEPVAIWSLLEFLSDRDLGESLPSDGESASKQASAQTEAGAPPPPTLQVSTAAQVRRLAPILEKVWVRDIFVPSLEEIDAKLLELESLKKAVSIKDVEAALKNLSEALPMKLSEAPPPMKLCCFKKKFDPSSHFRTEVKLPAGYKILSGGVTALDQTEGNFIVSSYPKYDETTRIWSWCVDAKDVEIKSAEAHSIRVIGIFDPDNEWDVRLFSAANTSKKAEHTVTAGEKTGYTITGGGAYIDEFEAACLTSCGFVTWDAGDSLVVVDGFSASSKQFDVKPTPRPHILTAVAIGIRATNGARISLRATRLKTAKASHIDQPLSLGRDVIGGGVYSKENVANYLTGSCPEIQDNGVVCGWHGSSKDHDGRVHPNELEIVALQPVNVKVTYEPIKEPEVRPGK
ncbi:MAC/perforin domain-containing protein [Ralstonia pseudosolanacearum]